MKINKKITKTHKTLWAILLILIAIELCVIAVSAGISYKTNNKVTLHTDENGTTVMGDLEVMGTISLEHIKIKTIDENNWTCNETTKGEIVHLLDNESLGTHMACRQKKGGTTYEAKPLY